jgi:fructan beta-fructosidase
MTLPRELRMEKVKGKCWLVTEPVKEVEGLAGDWKPFKGSVRMAAPCELRGNTASVGSFRIVLSNDAGEKAVVGYDKDAGQWYVDRRGAGKEDFHKDFAGRHVAPRIGQAGSLSFRLIADVASLELFADGGLTVMSELVFPSRPYDKIEVVGEDGTVIKSLQVAKMKGIHSF